MRTQKSTHHFPRRSKKLASAETPKSDVESDVEPRAKERWRQEDIHGHPRVLRGLLLCASWGAGDAEDAKVARELLNFVWRDCCP